MAIIPTKVWVEELFDQLENQRGKLPSFQPLMKHFPNWSTEEWLHFLYNQGMMPIVDETEGNWQNWQKNDPIKGMKELYSKLVETFQGPDVDIFLFPFNHIDKSRLKIMNGRNGISFPTFILLFFHEKLTVFEKQALLLHEYHHVCRLHHQKKDVETVTLLESIIMEGLAEWEVKRLLGEQYVSPWMKKHTKESLLSWWGKKIRVRKDVKGRKQHIPFIYGGTHGYPLWLGYGLGFLMVESYLEKYKDNPPPPIKLLKTPPNEILKGSIFSP
ncbi:uncharacterized protein YjaZ [Evansella vedderi]|uniref:Uncharacterized protein YjaZ n=1 Tax=Evansella vedderi TaxID=38282 RepID=A0ABT9ZWS6_9BACI|nr:DUF2268 domain-containing putative Zn-dependent protease [Evansella vedderi]MDQ0255410.1 uncharacterized protein YjaZ [Evansella vedderi]